MQRHIRSHTTCSIAMLGFLGVLGACTEASESTLAQRARALDSVPVPAAPEPPPPKLLPLSRVTPAGVDSELWASLHWLPTSLFEVSGFPDHEPPLVMWLRNQPELEHPACTRALDGVEHMLMAQDSPFPPQTQILFGSIDRADVEACAAIAMPRFGGSMSVRGPHGETTVLAIGQEETLLGWAQLGDSAVVIVEADPATLERFLAAEPDRFAGHGQLVPLLRTLDRRSGRTWSVTQADWSGAMLGIPGIGTAWSMDMGYQSGRFQMAVQLSFADPAMALEAEPAARGLLVEVRETMGVELDATCRVDAPEPRVTCEMVIPIHGDQSTALGTLERLVELLERRRAAHTGRESVPAR